MTWAARIGSTLLAAAAVNVFAPAGVASADTAPAMIGATNTSVTYDCGDVNVAGTNNAVHLETVARIEATGTGNSITWQSGPGGAAPQISNTGIRNVVNQGQVVTTRASQTPGAVERTP